MSPEINLAGSLFRRLFSYYLGLALVISCLQLGIEYFQARAQIAADLVTLGQSFAPSVADALWTYDRPRLDSLAQGVLQNKSVSGITIETSTGDLIASAGFIPKDEPTTATLLSDHKSHQIPLSLSAHHQNQANRSLGQLTLYPNREAVAAQVQHTLLTIVVTSLAQTLGLWLIFHWVMAWRLSRPLTALSEAIATLDVKDHPEQPPLIHYPHPDEIGQLVAAINQMRLKLASFNQELERKVAERTLGLQMAHAFNETVILNSPIAMAVYQGVGPCVQANEAYAQLAGLPRQGLLGQDLRSNRFGQDSGLLKNCINALANQQQYRREICIQIPLGKQAWFDCLILPTLMNNQPHLLLQFFDLTEIRGAADALHQAKTLAETASQAKSDFLADMSHEIRTPLNTIIGLAYLVLKTDLSAKQQDHLQKIHEASQQLLSLINDVLDFSNIEMGKLSLDQREFDLHNLFDSVVDQLGKRASDKGLELVLDIASSVPRCLIGDAVRLRQILLRLGQNAIQLTEQGEIDLLVRTSKRINDKVLIRFSIRDTSSPSTAQDQPLSRLFRQNNTLMPRKYDSVGLGLAVSKRLIELMGGEIGLDSDNSGATVWFTTRFGIGTETNPPLQPQPLVHNRRVLVVDDNEHAREAMHEMLRSMTFAVAAVASGREALAEITRCANSPTPYELIFLDWQMPDMDGITTACEIRALALNSPPRIILFTAHGRDSLLKVARKAGVEDVLPKPITPSSLFEAVMRVLATKRIPYESATVAVPSEADLSHIAGARILLVEDNDLNQAVASEMLANAGFQVDIAQNGAIALSKVEHHDYDLILMDMQMPIMDGLAATRAIRKQQRGLEVPIIAMTANALSGDREQCLAAGMNDHVAKPIDPPVLWAKLQRWLEARQALSPQPEAIAITAAPTLVAADLEALRDIPGFDLTLGLQQVLGQEKLYRALLQKFSANAQSFSNQLQSALVAEDWELAERLAHTLKGSSAQIGAYLLRDQAEQLEQAIHEQQPLTVLATLQTTLSHQLTALTALIKNTFIADPPLPAPVDANSVDEIADQTPFHQICTELARLLAADDCNSTQLLQQHEKVLRAQFPSEFPEIAQAVDDFDFPSALEKLQQAAAKQSIDL